MAKSPALTSAQKLRAKILSASVLKEKLVKFPDGSDVLIRQATMKRAMELNGINVSGHVLAILLSCYDPQTKEPLFTVDDIDVLESLPYEFCVEIMVAINSISDPIEGEVLGNSSGTQGESSN